MLIPGQPPPPGLAGVTTGFGINVPPPGPPVRVDPRLYTADEVRRQVNAVEQLLLQNISVRKIVDTGAPQLGVSRDRMRKLIQRVYDKWNEEDAETRSVNKAAAVRRAHEALRSARGWNLVTGDRDRPINHSAALRWEQHLADLQGLYAPIEVDINVQYTEALLNVIVHQEPEELMRIVETEKERDRLAEAFQREHPEVARDLAPTLLLPERTA